MFVSTGVSKNSIAATGSFAASGGAGVAVTGEDRHLEMVNCVVGANSVSGSTPCESGPRFARRTPSAAESTSFGDYPNENGPSADIVNCTIAENSADAGGGIGLYKVCEDRLFIHF